MLTMHDAKRKTKMVIFILLTAMLLSVVSFHRANAQSEPPIKVAVDTKRIVFSVEPRLQDGTTLVQMRPLFEAMGITLQWDQQTRTITGKKAALSIILQIDNKEAVVNDSKMILEQPAQLIDGNTLVPLRFIGEATGAIVVWDGKRREITIFTEEMIQKLGLTRQQVEKIVADIGGVTLGQTQTDGSNQQGQPKEDGTSGTVTVGENSQVDINQLSGMYYGLRNDIGGFECGGVCWEFYTFLPDNKIVVGELKKGGPESLDCEKDACSTYSIKDSKLIVDNGSNYAIRISENGKLTIEDVELSPVVPVADGLKLEGKYVYQGYSGLIGINSASSAWEEWITFKRDGSFESDTLTMSTLDTHSAVTNSSASKVTAGTYQIKGNTITLKYSNGEEHPYVFFLHPDKQGKPNAKDVQVGQRNFYIDKN